MRPTIVAAVQFEPKPLAVDENLVMLQQLVFEAAAKGARIIVAPELCTGGGIFHSPAEAARAAQELDGYQTQALVPLAKQFNAYVAFGYVETRCGKLYNSTVVISPDGSLTPVQKKNLHGQDHLWATPSEQVSPVVMTPYGRVGCLICRDAKNNFRDSYAAYDSNHRFYTKGSVDTIMLLTNWGTSAVYPANAWCELQESTGANVIVSNRIGTDHEMNFKGGSCVISRDGHVYTHGSSFDAPAIVGGILK